jgi:predicted AAA+ superfamily ATPase
MEDKIIMCIEGERCVGKTSLLLLHYEYLKKEGKEVYILGHNYMSTLRLHKIVGLKELRYGRGCPATNLDYILIDEFGLFKNFELLRYLELNNKKKIKYIITKSNTK